MKNQINLDRLRIQNELMANVKSIYPETAIPNLIAEVVSQSQDTLPELNAIKNFAIGIINGNDNGSELKTSQNELEFSDIRKAPAEESRILSLPYGNHRLFFSLSKDNPKEIIFTLVKDYALAKREI